jgi:hypothetical protein
MEKVDALAKNLRFMIALDSEALSSMHSPEAFVQPRTNVRLC